MISLRGGGAVLNHCQTQYRGKFNMITTQIIENAGKSSSRKMINLEQYFRIRLTQANEIYDGSEILKLAEDLLNQEHQISLLIGSNLNINIINIVKELINILLIWVDKDVKIVISLVQTLSSLYQIMYKYVINQKNIQKEIKDELDQKLKDFQNLLNQQDYLEQDLITIHMNIYFISSINYLIGSFQEEDNSIIKNTLQSVITLQITDELIDNIKDIFKQSINSYFDSQLWKNIHLMHTIFQIRWLIDYNYDDEIKSKQSLTALSKIYEQVKQNKNYYLKLWLVVHVKNLILQKPIIQSTQNQQGLNQIDSVIDSKHQLYPKYISMIKQLIFGDQTFNITPLINIVDNKFIQQSVNYTNMLEFYVYDYNQSNYPQFSKILLEYQSTQDIKNLIQQLTQDNYYDQIEQLQNLVLQEQETLNNLRKILIYLTQYSIRAHFLLNQVSNILKEISQNNLQSIYDIADFNILELEKMSHQDFQKTLQMNYDDLQKKLTVADMAFNQNYSQIQTKGINYLYLTIISKQLFIIFQQIYLYLQQNENILQCNSQLFVILQTIKESKQLKQIYTQQSILPIIGVFIEVIMNSYQQPNQYKYDNMNQICQQLSDVAKAVDFCKFNVDCFRLNLDSLNLYQNFEQILQKNLLQSINNRFFIKYPDTLNKLFLYAYYLEFTHYISNSFNKFINNNKYLLNSFYVGVNNLIDQQLKKSISIHELIRIEEFIVLLKSTEISQDQYLVDSNIQKMKQILGDFFLQYDQYSQNQNENHGFQNYLEDIFNMTSEACQIVIELERIFSLIIQNPEQELYEKFILIIKMLTQKIAAFQKNFPSQFQFQQDIKYLNLISIKKPIAKHQSYHAVIQAQDLLKKYILIYLNQQRQNSDHPFRVEVNLKISFPEPTFDQFMNQEIVDGIFQRFSINDVQQIHKDFLNKQIPQINLRIFKKLNEQTIKEKVQDMIISNIGENANLLENFIELDRDIWKYNYIISPLLNYLNIQQIFKNKQLDKDYQQELQKMIIKYYIFQTDERVLELYNFDTIKMKIDNNQDQLQQEIKEEFKHLENGISQTQFSCIIETNQQQKDQNEQECDDKISTYSQQIKNAEIVLQKANMKTEFLSEMKDSIIQIKQGMQDIKQGITDILSDIKYLKGKTIQQLLNIRKIKIYDIAMKQGLIGFIIPIITIEKKYQLIEGNYSATYDPQTDLFEEINEFINLDVSKDSLLIHGVAGSGKSTSTKLIEFQLWQQFDKNNVIVPILIQLSSIKNPQNDIMEETLKQQQYGFNKQQILEFLDQVQKGVYKIVFIFDSYDELKQEYQGLNLIRTNKLKEIWKQQQNIDIYPKFVTSSRTEIFQSNQYYLQFMYDQQQLKFYKEIELMKFNEKTVELYIKEHVQFQLKKICYNYFQTYHKIINQQQCISQFQQIWLQCQSIMQNSDQLQILTQSQIQELTQILSKSTNVDNKELIQIQQDINTLWPSNKYLQQLQQLNLVSILETPFITELVVFILPKLVIKYQNIFNFKQQVVNLTNLEIWQQLIDNEIIQTQFQFGMNSFDLLIQLSKLNFQKAEEDQRKKLEQQFQLEIEKLKQSKRKQMVQELPDHKGREIGIMSKKSKEGYVNITVPFNLLNVIKRQKLTQTEFYILFIDNYFENQLLKQRDIGVNLDVYTFKQELWHHLESLAVYMQINQLTNIIYQQKGLLQENYKRTIEDRYFDDSGPNGQYRILFRQCSPIRQRYNNYQFNHKSIQEFLAANHFIQCLRQEQVLDKLDDSVFGQTLINSDFHKGMINYVIENIQQDKQLSQIIEGLLQQLTSPKHEKLFANLIYLLTKLRFCLKNQIFNKSSFVRIDLSGVVFIECQFKECIFENVTLLNGIFNQCKFDSCQFKNMQFQSSILKHNNQQIHDMLCDYSEGIIILSSSDQDLFININNKLFPVIRLKLANNSQYKLIYNKVSNKRTLRNYDTFLLFVCQQDQVLVYRTNIQPRDQFYEFDLEDKIIGKLLQPKRATDGDIFKVLFIQNNQMFAKVYNLGNQLLSEDVIQKFSATNLIDSGIPQIDKIIQQNKDNKPTIDLQYSFLVFNKTYHIGTNKNQIYSINDGQIKLLHQFNQNGVINLIFVLQNILIVHFDGKVYIFQTVQNFRQILPISMEFSRGSIIPDKNIIVLFRSDKYITIDVSNYLRDQLYLFGDMNDEFIALGHQNQIIIQKQFQTQIEFDFKSNGDIVSVQFSTCLDGLIYVIKVNQILAINFKTTEILSIIDETAQLLYDDPYGNIFFKNSSGIKSFNLLSKEKFNMDIINFVAYQNTFYVSSQNLVYTSQDQPHIFNIESLEGKYQFYADQFGIFAFGYSEKQNQFYFTTEKQKIHIKYDLVNNLVQENIKKIIRFNDSEFILTQKYSITLMNHQKALDELRFNFEVLQLKVNKQSIILTILLSSNEIQQFIIKDNRFLQLRSSQINNLLFPGSSFQNQQTPKEFIEIQNYLSESELFEGKLQNN